jgi:hypothetical protein
VRRFGHCGATHTWLVLGTAEAGEFGRAYRSIPNEIAAMYRIVEREEQRALAAR